MLKHFVTLSCLLLTNVVALADEIEPKIAVGMLTCHYDPTSSSPFSCDRSALKELSQKVKRDINGSWSVVFSANDSDHQYMASFWVSPRKTSQGTRLGANITLNIDGKSVGRAVQIAQKGMPLNSGQLSAATSYVNATTIVVPVLLYSIDGTPLDALYEAVAATVGN